MEIYYWFLFFSLMIFLSFLSWNQLFLLFIFKIVMLGGYFNLDSYKISENPLFQLLAFIIDLSMIVFSTIALGWHKFTTETYIGIKFFTILVFLENNYQKIKMEFKKELVKQLVKTSMSNTVPLVGTPRISYDSDETDEE